MRSCFSKEDIENFEYALKINNLTPQECHIIMYVCGMKKNQYNSYYRSQKLHAYQMLLDDIEGRRTVALRHILNHRNTIHENKRILVTEEQMRNLLEEEADKVKVSFYVEPEKVLLVKKYLDKAFKRGVINGIDDNGYPKTIQIVGMIGGDGNIVRNLTDLQLFYLLQDRFSGIYGDKKHRDSLLRQIIKDWYHNKISKEGLLSVNLL